MTADSGDSDHRKAVQTGTLWEGWKGDVMGIFLVRRSQYVSSSSSHLSIIIARSVPDLHCCSELWRSNVSIFSELALLFVCMCVLLLHVIGLWLNNQSLLICWQKSKAFKIVLLCLISILHVRIFCSFLLSVSLCWFTYGRNWTTTLFSIVFKIGKGKTA